MLKKCFIVGALTPVLAVLLTLWCVDALTGLAKNGDEERRFFRPAPRPLGLASTGAA